jgi:hypothetical protein
MDPVKISKEAPVGSLAIVHVVHTYRTSRAVWPLSAISFVLLLTACEVGAASPAGVPSVRAVTPSPSASATTPPTSAASAGWERFTSLRFGYSVALPAGWLIEEVAGVGGVDPGQPGTDTFTGDNRILIISRSDIPPGTPLGTWRSPVIEHYEGPEPAGHGVLPLDEGSLSIDGQPGRWLEYRVVFGAYDQLILHAETVVGDRALLVTYIGLGGDDAAYRAEFDELVASLALSE